MTHHAHATTQKPGPRVYATFRGHRSLVCRVIHRRARGQPAQRRHRSDAASRCHVQTRDRRCHSRRRRCRRRHAPTHAATPARRRRGFRLTRRKSPRTTLQQKVTRTTRKTKRKRKPRSWARSHQTRRRPHPRVPRGPAEPASRSRLRWSAKPGTALRAAAKSISCGISSAMQNALRVFPMAPSTSSRPPSSLNHRG